MRDPLEQEKNFGKKLRNLNDLTVPKKGGTSYIVKKSEKGDPSALEWLFISC